MIRIVVNSQHQFLIVDINNSLSDRNDWQGMLCRRSLPHFGQMINWLLIATAAVLLVLPVEMREGTRQTPATVLSWLPHAWLSSPALLWLSRGALALGGLLWLLNRGLPWSCWLTTAGFTALWSLQVETSYNTAHIYNLPNMLLVIQSLWISFEAPEIRELTERPRSEFFAVRHDFLHEALRQRWYAYEQTVVMLLQAVFDKNRISRFLVGNISDLAEGRESLASAMQQVERTERVLKSVWRQHHHPKAGWTEEYRRLELQSEQVRRAALVILQNLLG